MFIDAVACDSISFLFFPVFFPYGKLHITWKLLSQQFLSIQFTGIMYIHVIVQLSSPSISRTLSLSCETETCTHLRVIPYCSLS